MKYLYKYTQKKYPYEHLVEENAKRSRLDPEYEIFDTNSFDDNRYFDIFIEMAKDTDNEEELLFRITAYNRGPEPAPLHIIPQAWFRNTWGWGIESEKDHSVPSLKKIDNRIIQSDHWKLGTRYMHLAPSPGFDDYDNDTPTGSEDGESTADDVFPTLLFTNNETNKKKLYNVKNDSPYVKDAFHDYIISEDESAVNPKGEGTKACAWYAFDRGDGIPPGDFVTVRFKYTPNKPSSSDDFDEEEFDNIMDQRQDEADDFYWRISPSPISDDLRCIQRQAFAGLLWTKQFYHFVHSQWSKGDPANPPPPEERANVRNQQWKHLHADDILSLPDKWEYPFFAAWDSAFHCIPLAMVDPEFAKKQLDLLTREWYMHPNGQIPAYEWNFSDVNPPVHAWATFRTFKIERKMFGNEDIDFLERVFQKLLLNFTWWVNRKDGEGKNVFEGGFLGLDNIGLFNRSEPLPTGGVLEQADSTGWMAFFCLQMLNIALELAKHRPIYEDIASKFFEHFIYIADAMSFRSDSGAEKSLWNDEDGFYYDAISWGGPWSQQLPVRSLVGLIPLYASLTLEPQVLKRFKSFDKRVKWFIDNRKDMTSRNIASMSRRGTGERMLLSLVNKERLEKILERMLDETEFLSEHGIRSLSKYHKDHPYSMEVNGQLFTVDYVPGDSNSGLFGGNSNWRGPIWFPTNFLLIESLQRFYLYYGDSLKVEFPKNSGKYVNLARCAELLQHRLIGLFSRDTNGERASNGGVEILNHDPYWRDYISFFEFFEADTGRGLGASHQCGWTALIAKIIHDTGISCTLAQTPKTPLSAAELYFDDELISGRHHARRKSAVSVRLDRRTRSGGVTPGPPSRSDTLSSYFSVSGINPDFVDSLADESLASFGTRGNNDSGDKDQPQVDGAPIERVSSATSSYHNDMAADIQKLMQKLSASNDSGFDSDELETCCDEKLHCHHNN